MSMLNYFNFFFFTFFLINGFSLTLELPVSNAPLAPPTLSQAPLSQPHSSHRHTLPFTQEPAHDQTTILAPDSMNQSSLPQSAKDRKGSCSVLRVNETVYTGKSPSDKSPPLDKSSVLVKSDDAPEAVSDMSKNTMSDSKHPRGKDKHPTTSTAASTISSTTDNMDKSQLGGSSSKDKCLPDASNSTSVSSTTAATDLQTAAKTSEKSLKKSGEEAKAEPIDDLFGDNEEEEMEEDPAPSLVVRTGQEGEREKESKKNSTNEQRTPHDHHEKNASTSLPAISSERAPAPKPAEKKQSPNAPSLTPSSPSQLEGSVIVPCSLTPRTQDKMKKPPLPDSQTLAFAFGGRRKKRPHNEIDEDTENESKKKKEEKEEEREKVGGGGRGQELEDGRNRDGEAGEKGGVTGEDMKERGVAKGAESKSGVKETREGREKGEGGKRQSRNGETNTPSVGLFSGLKSKRTSTKPKSTAPAPNSKHQLPPIMAGLPLLETYGDTTTTMCKTEEPSLEQDTVDYQNEMVKNEPAEDMEIQPSSPVTHPTPSQSPPPTTQVTQVAPSTTPDPALFLSARRQRRKSQRGEDESVAPTPAPPATTSSSSRPVSPHTQITVATQVCSLVDFL